MHNILQGVLKPDEWLSDDEKRQPTARLPTTPSATGFREHYASATLGRGCGHGDSELPSSDIFRGGEISDSFAGSRRW
jgi:hypothetical protein